MNGGANAPKLEERRRVGFGEFRFDTPQLAAGSFIERCRGLVERMKKKFVKSEDP
jgi:hypothetical protein